MAVQIIALDVAWTLLHKEPIFTQLAELFSKCSSSFISEDQVRAAHRAVSEAAPISDQARSDEYQIVNRFLCQVLAVKWDPNLNQEIEKICRGTSWQPYQDAKLPFELGLPIAIFSNWKAGLSNYLTSQLDRKPDHVFCSTDEQVQKPAPEFYLRAIEKLGVGPHEILFVGDSLNLDFLPACRLGIGAVLLDRPGFYHGRDYARIESFTELSTYLN